MAFTSCNQGPTLQTYYVDNELKPGFASFDVPTSFLNIEAVEMTEEQREAYESVDKLNVLTYIEDDTDAAEYKVELETITTILKNPKYEELMRGGNSTDGKFVIKFLGDEEEVILDENGKTKKKCDPDNGKHASKTSFLCENKF